MSKKHQLNTVVLETTRRCNLRCLHCGSDCDTTDSRNELSVSEWQRVFTELAALGTEKIVFSGGEAFIKKDFDALLISARLNGLGFGIITNGIVLPDRYLELFSTVKPYAIGVSIDGNKDTHNYIRQNSQAWIKSLQTISRLVAAGIPTVVNTTISKLNYRELSQIGHTLHTLGVSGWQIQIAAPMGRMSDSDELLDRQEFNAVCLELYSLRHRYPEMVITGADCFGFDHLGLTRAGDWPGCQAGISGLGIRANGDVVPCLSLYGDQFIIANVREQSLADIWGNDHYFGFNRKFDVSAVGPSSRCACCDKFETCRGGCASMSWSFNAKLHDAPFCVYRDFETDNHGRK